MIGQEGYFITVEGIDGSGKSTVAEELAWTFGAVKTEEPSGSPVGQLLRESLQDETTAGRTDLFLFLADRNEHTNNTIKPALKEGRMVICDRYMDSTIAYQCANDVATQDQIKRMHRGVSIHPDLTIYVRTDPEVAVERLDTEEKYEDLTFLEDVMGEYEHLYYDSKRDIVIIDGNQPKEDMLMDVCTIVKARLIEENIRYNPIQ